MKRATKIVLVIGLVVALLGLAGYVVVRQVLPTPGQPAPLDPNQAAQALVFLDHLDAGRYDDAFAMLAPETQRALPRADLEKIWTALNAQLGARGERGPPRGERLGEHVFVATRLPYAMMALDARVRFDARRRIVGFTLVPALAAPAAPPADDAPYVERALGVGEGARALGGTLTLPRGDGPFAAAVLVHGSGPHDRDETIGPNKPFVDLARGLAARGIAVLRYEKRSLAQPETLVGDFAVDDETVDDAANAVRALRATGGIDPARVFVVGHSLGAMMAPRIAQREPALAGIAMLAAPARPLEDVVVDQYRYLAGLDGTVSPDEATQVATIAARRDDVKRLARGETVAPPLLLDLPASYWRDLASYDPVAVVDAIPQRVLILQGERDYQVTMAGDFARWLERFGAASPTPAGVRGQTRPRVTLRAFGALDHLFMPSDGPPSPADYQRARHVDPVVIDAIADWIVDDSVVARPKP